MKLLLDTHAVLWWLDDTEELTSAAVEAIRDTQNEVFVSAAVAWEIAIKRALGKLEAPGDLESAMTDAGFRSLPVTVAHALRTESLPPHHRDPFDRMLVAQALVEGMTLVTRDRDIQQYDVPVIHA